MENLPRLTAYRTKFPSIITCHSETTFSIIPWFFNGVFAIGHIGIIFCKISNYPRHGEKGSHKQDTKKIIRPLSECKNSQEINSDGNRQDQLQKNHGHCVSIKALGCTFIFFEKRRGFKRGFFKRANQKGKIHKNDGNNERQRVKSGNFGNKSNDATGKKPRQSTEGFEHIKISRIFVFFNQNLKESIENFFHVTSLKIHIKSAFSIAFITNCTK